MRKDQVNSSADALAYIMDCQLATVIHAIGKRSSAKSDVERQISIAQQGIDWMRVFGVDFESTRAADVVKQFDGSVSRWSEQYRA